MCCVRESSRSLSVMCLRPESQGVVLTTSQSPPHCMSWWLHAHRWRNSSWDIQVLQLGELSEEQTTPTSSGRKIYTHISTGAERCSYLHSWWFFPCGFMLGKPGRQPWGQRGAQELDKQRAHLWVGGLTAWQPGHHHLRHQSSSAASPLPGKMVCLSWLSHYEQSNTLDYCLFKEIYSWAGSIASHSSNFQHLGTFPTMNTSTIMLPISPGDSLFSGEATHTITSAQSKERKGCSWLFGKSNPSWKKTKQNDSMYFPKWQHQTPSTNRLKGR